jgi:hypothetical protein
MNGIEYFEGVDVTNYTRIFNFSIELLRYIIAAILLLYIIIKATTEFMKIRKK